MVGPRASASCEVWVNDQRVACERDDLFAGQPTVLNELSFPWGRRSLWEQPDPGTISFRIRDQRTSPQPLENTVHAGAKIDVWAGVPIDSPAPTTVMNQNFQGVATAGGILDPQLWHLHTYPATVLRRNRYTDPNFTTVSGKSVGGSATIYLDPIWKVSGEYSIRITPNGTNNASALYLWPSGTVLNGFVPGQTYTISATLRIGTNQTGTLAPSARTIVAYGVVGGSTITFGSSTQTPNVSGEYLHTVTFTVPAGATGVNVRLMNGSPVSNVWWDAVLLTQTDAAAHGAFFDGSSSRAGYGYAWTGTANASASTESYLASSGNETVFIFDAASSPPGEGTRSAYLLTSGRRAAYEFPPYRFLSDWPRNIARYMEAGETWNYSIMVRMPAGGRMDLSFLARSNSDPEQPTQNVIIAVDGAAVRQISGTGEWVTYTGTLTNTGDRPVWPTYYLLCYPSSFNAPQVNPAIDALQLVAPAQDEKRILVWSGRASDVEVVPAERSAVMINVTGAAAAAEVANYSVGDVPWPSESIASRMRRVFDAVPFPINRDFTMSLDLQVGTNPAVGNVRPRDVDKQPILGLLQDYAEDCFAAVWPVNHPVSRNHLWVENVALRGFAWVGRTVRMSACNLPKGRFRILQTTAEMLTVADVEWLQTVIDPETSEVSYEPVTETVTDDDAVDMYGAMRIKIDTELSSSAAAGNLGAAVLDWSRASRWAIDGVSFDTKHVDNSDGVAQSLLEQLLSSARRPGTHIEIDDLPEYCPIDVASGFIEGGTVTYRDGRWVFELNVSSGNPNGGS